MELKFFKALLFSVFMGPTLAFASGGVADGGGDCFPAEWNLPNKGENCSLQVTFPSTNQSAATEYQLWECNAPTKLFLIHFEIVTDSNSENHGCRKKIEVMVQR